MKEEKEMKKTNYIMMISSSFCGQEKYRRVWKDENGNFFVKVDGELRNVNHAKRYFIAD